MFRILHDRALVDGEGCGIARSLPTNYVREELDVTGGTAAGSRRSRAHDPSPLCRGGSDSKKATPPDFAVTDDPSLADITLVGFELRLDQDDAFRASGVRGQQSEKAPEDARKRYERQIGHEEVGCRRIDVVRSEVANVGPFTHPHPRVVSDAVVDLPVTDVERLYVLGTVLEQAVGESARRDSCIEAPPTTWIDGEGGQAMFELVAAPGDVPPCRSGNDDCLGRVDERRRLRSRGVVDADEAALDDVLCGGAALDKPATHQFLVETSTAHTNVTGDPGLSPFLQRRELGDDLTVEFLQRIDAVIELERIDLRQTRVKRRDR